MILSDIRLSLSTQPEAGFFILFQRKVTMPFFLQNVLPFALSMPYNVMYDVLFINILIIRHIKRV